ncbi:porphobilinogen deaminase, dipyromethane cofactor binding domain-containing protein [Gymnopilus junonius]|uniref:hydroxymethylbilane synthase n=1 Tax=Gymnopilus junonius TaxID=109634 RepID=A0A9P5NEW1_GYMJU|nr:porphobilinogen deaminase, dipyromethane cofactor binding domain-containing protein [Gymnopilus junonius]
MSLQHSKNYIHLSEDDTLPLFTTSFMSTAGDKNQSPALYLLGGKPLDKRARSCFERRRGGHAHPFLQGCAHDLAGWIVLSAILEREDPVDSLRGWTSSVRRVAQLKRKYPDFKFLDVRGNLNTRMAKLDAPDGPYAALVLAKAGLVRLGWGDRISSDISPPTLFHAVSQGALAIEVRSDDTEALELCKKIAHREDAVSLLELRAAL